METAIPLTPLPQSEEITRVEEVKPEWITHPPTTRAATKANQPNNNPTSKPKEELREGAEEEDNHQEEVREELMELKPPNHRTSDQNAWSVE